MGKKRDRNMPKLEAPEVEGEEGAAPSGTTMYAVENLTQTMMTIPIFNENGQADHLHLRLQGRNGQKPPVIPSTAVTDKMRTLEKKRLIRLVQVQG
jgi:hypothetical protein